MNKLRNYLKEAAGLIVLAAIVVLAALFFSTRNPLRSARVAETPTAAQPVPTPTELTFVSPIVTPTAEATPTEVKPTPTPSPTPTPPVVVVPGPLPPGLKIVGVDMTDDGWTSIIWVANADNPNQRQIIAKTRNLQMLFPLQGYISPDGRQMAYILPRKSIYSTLGIMNVDGSETRILDDAVEGEGQEWNVRWSSDGQWIAYVRAVPQTKEWEKSDIWLIHPDGTGQRHLASGAATSVYPVGWSRDNSQLYYATTKDLWAVDADGKMSPSLLLHLSDTNAFSLRLSPDREKIGYATLEGPQSNRRMAVRVSRIDGRESRILAENIDKSFFAGLGYSLRLVWSPDSTRLAYDIPADEGHFKLMSAQWTAPETAVSIRGKEAVYYYLLSWSPDGKFIAALQRSLDTDPENTVFLSIIGLDGSVQRVYTIEPRFSVSSFVGWLGGGGGQ